MGYMILGLMALFVVGMIWLVKFIKKIEAKRHQRFMDFAQERGLKHSLLKMGVGGGFNKVEGQLNGCKFSLQEMSDGVVRQTRFHKTVAIIESKKLDYCFIIGSKNASGIPKDLEDLSSYDLGLNDSTLITKTNDHEKISQSIVGHLEEFRALEDSFESAIIGYDGRLMYTVNVLIPNEKRFQSFSKIVDSMIKFSNDI
jgi:hypothetical protein